MTRLLLLRYDFRDRNQNLDREQADTVLVVPCEMLEQRDHLLYDDRSGHLLYEFCEIVGCLTSDHRSIIVNQLAELLPEALL